jgi:hypothetical protein
MKDKWGKVYYQKLKLGWDNGAAAFAADAAVKRLEHKTSSDCWCEPELDYVDPVTGDEVWVHRDYQ